MTLKNYLILFGTISLCYGLWVYLPGLRANYRKHRTELEQQFDAETLGKVLSIKERYRPAGDDGIIRFTGYEIRYQLEVDGQTFVNSVFIPKNPDPVINQKLKKMIDSY